MTGLNQDSRRLLDEAFPQGDAWLVMGLHDASDVMHPTAEGRPGSFGLRDDRDLYYCVSTTGPAGRKDVRRVMVLVIDDVGKEIDGKAFTRQFPLEPSFVVESSKGSYQVGFIIKGGMAPEDYSALRRAMKAHPVWGKAHNAAPANIFRLPQGTHTKPARGDWRVRLEKANWRHWPEEELWKALAPLGAPAVTAPAGSVAVADTITDGPLLQKLLDIIPNPVRDWDFFVNVGMAVWKASEGMGWEAYLAWASKFPGHDDSVTQARWDSFRTVRIGRFWLLREAKLVDAKAAEAWLRLEAGSVFDDDMGLLGASAGDDGEGSIEALQLTVANEQARLHGERLRFNVDSKCWHEFDGVWRESPYRIGYRLAREWATRALTGPLAKGARSSIGKSAFCEGVEVLMQSVLAITGEAFDRDDWLLGTPKGTVELRTGRLRQARAGDMISLSTTVEPSAGEDCPKWKKFIDWACTDGAGKVDAGMVRFLKQWAGYCLTGDVSKEMVVFLHGVGANGKGTFIETLQAVMGTYFYMAPKDLFMETRHGAHTEELAGLARVRMVAADEVPVTARWNESLLKACSGGGTMTTRHLYGRVFTFRIRFKVTISGNNKPTFQGEINEALKRRLHMAGFLQVAKPKSDTLKAELAAEGRGILRWMLNGLSDMLGSPGGKLFVADSMLATTEDYFNDNDLFGQWLKERVRKVKGGETGAQDAYNDWVSWRNAQGNHFMFNRGNTFKAEMEKRGFLWVKTMKANVYKGISIEMF